MPDTICQGLAEEIPHLSRCLHQTTDVGPSLQTQIPHCGSPLSHGLEFSGLSLKPSFSHLLIAAALLDSHLGVLLLSPEIHRVYSNCEHSYWLRVTRLKQNTDNKAIMFTAP